MSLRQACVASIRMPAFGGLDQQGEQQQPGGQHRKPLILWNNDPIGPVSSAEKTLAFLQICRMGRVQPRIDSKGLTLLTPGLLLLSTMSRTSREALCRAKGSLPRGVIALERDEQAPPTLSRRPGSPPATRRENSLAEPWGRFGLLHFSTAAPFRSLAPDRSRHASARSHGLSYRTVRAPLIAPCSTPYPAA